MLAIEFWITYQHFCRWPQIHKLSDQLILLGPCPAHNRWNNILCATTFSKSESKSVAKISMVHCCLFFRELKQSIHTVKYISTAMIHHHKIKSTPYVNKINKIKVPTYLLKSYRINPSANLRTSEKHRCTSGIFRRHRQPGKTPNEQDNRSNWTLERNPTNDAE